MDNLNIKYKLVDTAGQITAVVFSETKKDEQSSIAQKLMDSNPIIEQVVFIEKNRIQTMGNELCINGSLAGAYLSKRQLINISGLEETIRFEISQNFISAKFPRKIVQVINKNIVKLTGIVYKISNNCKFSNKKYLNYLARRYQTPASGQIFFNKNKIKPIIYVKKTDSLVSEKACGSGSLAYSIYSGLLNISQPSDQIISIKKANNYFTVKVPIKIAK